AIRAVARLVAIEDLETAEHPGALLAAGAEGPATGDAVPAVDGDGPATTLHGGAGDGDFSGPEDLLDAFRWQTERDELGDVVVAEIPADRAGRLGQQLDRPQIGQRIELQPAQLSRSDEAVEARRVTLLDQPLRQALLALELVTQAADHRLERRRRLHGWLRFDVSGETRVLGHLSHRLDDVPLAKWRCQEVLSLIIPNQESSSWPA